ncbi:MAG: phosphoglucomutase/phosphomannomutase family protein [Balneolaceae bacterium]|nr:phosphoglucomutase/phosphomannomutase family protein [Balneolaceae bacterium]MDR9446799.1 phosphoglucomutase/phosphomannomutase family protein [Balneolaceae bacterium]
MIRFGTDGWRAIIAKDFTFDNVNLVTQATARWIQSESITSHGVVIGHDARFLGREFAEHCACTFAAMSIPVKIAKTIAPTPAVSWGALEYDAVGIVITASHNPPAYNGFKIKAPFGGPATPDQITAVESFLPSIDAPLTVKDFETYVAEGLIQEIDLVDDYMKDLAAKLDLDAIRQSGLKIAHDAMYGAGMGLIEQLLPGQVVSLHDDVNPSFYGQAPEPIERNLPELPKAVLDHGCAVGLANDGDADRIGMVDERGVFVDSHQMLSLLTWYQSQVKGLKGDVIKTFSTTTMLDKMADAYGLGFETRPIGFKHVAERIISGDVLVGGEESGGLAVKGHIPERDGLYIGLLITEMVVTSGKTLSELIQGLFDEFGLHATWREDLHTEEGKKQAMMDACKAKKITEIAGLKVQDWDMLDGVKHLMDDGSWLLVRPSGTEPVLRIYSEADTHDKAQALVKETVAMVDNLPV